MTMGDMFRAKREGMGLTQVQTAQSLFVSQPFYAQVETGMKLPTVGMVKAAAELFSCTTDEIIFGGERRGA